MPAKKVDSTIVITAVRNNRKSLRIEWMEGADTCGRDFHDMPLPSFYKAIDALGEHVVALCEFSAKDAEKIQATGITVRDKGENSFALIVARKKIRKGKRVFNISTPLLPMYADKENKGADHMEADQAKAVEKVISEAIKYLGGERAQGQIKFEEEEKPKGDSGPSNVAKFPEMETDPS